MLLFLWLSIVAGISIQDGESLQGSLSDLSTTSHKFEYFHSEVSDSELVVFVSCSSDVSDPVLYWGTSIISSNNFDISSSLRNHALIRISPEHLTLNTTYHILLQCELFCSYSISLSHLKPINLPAGFPLTASVDSGKILRFSFKIHESSEFASISARFSGDLEMIVFNSEDLASSLETTSNWIDDLEFFQQKVNPGDFFLVVLRGLKDSRFSLLGKDSETDPVSLLASQVYTDSISRSGYSYYYIEVNSYVAKVEVSLTIFSGDADLYLSFSSQPSEKKYDLFSQGISNDFIKVDRSSFSNYNFISGKVYLTVHGYMESSFSLVARLDQFSSVALFDGIPQQATILQDEILNFYYEIPNESFDLSIYLTTFSGDADFFVKFCDGRCHISKEEILQSSVYKSVGSASLQTLDFKFEPETQCGQSKKCNYAVAVLGVSRSFFSLTAALVQAKIKLQQGLSFIMSAPVAGVKFFEFSVTNPSVIEIDFTLTPILGDPDLCITTLNMQGECEKQSEKSGVDVDQVTFIKGEEKESLESLYLISVGCSTGCYYSLVVREKVAGKNSTIHLIPGHPQKDTLYNITHKDFRLYFFSVDSLKTDIKIVLTGLTGKFSLFVSNNPNNIDWENEVFYYNWKVQSNDDNTDVLLIHKEDKHYVTDTTYLVLVQADRFSADNSASYIIQFARSSDILMLAADVNTVGQVSSEEYTFYSFPIHYSHMDLVVSLTVSSGDPDLYISFDYLNSRPTKDSYSIKSSHFGSESVTLLWDDEISSFCEDITQNYVHGNSHGCFLYISVYSQYPSSFTLRVSPISELPKFMPRASFIHGSLNEGQYDFYYMFVDVTDQLVVILQNTVGESDLLVSLTDRDKASPDIQDWTRPSEDYAMIKVKNLLTEEVKLTSLQLQEFCSKTCLVLVSLKCVTTKCLFLLENPEADVTKINEGQAKYGMAGKEMQFYQYFCDKEEDILIVVTPIESCDPSLYVVKGKNRRPSVEDFDWSSRSSAGDSVKISPGDPQFIDDEKMTGVYTIGVLSEHDLCSFTLTVTNHQFPVVVINPGLPQLGTSGNGVIAYYALYNSFAQQVTVTVTPRTGSPFIVISTHKDTEDEFYADLPTYVYFKWNSNYGNDKYSVKVTSSDPGFCTNCYYLIGVYSDSSSSFTITATTEVDMKMLQNGVPHRSSVLSNSWNIYSFAVNLKKDINILLSEYSGEVTLEVSLSKDMSSSNWTPISGLRTKSLKISSDDPNFQIGTYYLKVSSKAPESLYSILWFTSSSYISLVDGWSMIYTLDGKSDKSLNLKFNQPGSVFCSVESLFHQFHPTISAFTSSKKSSTKKSLGIFGNSNYTGNHLSLDFDIDSSEILLLQVSSPELTFLPSYEFSLYCTVSFHPAFLTLGKQAIGHLGPNLNSLRYEFNLEKSQRLEVYVVPCEGNVKLLASTNWTVIKGESAFLTETRLSEGLISARIDDIEGKVYLTVMKNTQSPTATFKIYANDKQLPRLSAGNQGFISWNYDREKVKLEWKGLEYSNSSKFEGKVTYYVFFTENSEVPVQSTCQTQYATSHGMGEWITNTRELSVTLFLKKEGFISIVAHVEEEGNIALRDVIYDKTRISGNVERAQSGKLIFMLSLIVLVLLIGLGVYCWKFRRVEAEIKTINEIGKPIGNEDVGVANITANEV